MKIEKDTITQHCICYRRRTSNSCNAGWGIKVKPPVLKMSRIKQGQMKQGIEETLGSLLETWLKKDYLGEIVQCHCTGFLKTVELSFCFTKEANENSIDWVLLVFSFTFS